MKMNRTLTVLMLGAAACITFNACKKSSSTPAPVITQIDYHNNTITPIYITVNGVLDTIPSGGAITLNGEAGTTATGSALTFSLLGTVKYGKTITWAIADSFPASGIKNVPLNTGSGYYFLAVNNISTHSISYVDVNLGSAEEVIDTVSGFGVIPLGYYVTVPSPTIRVRGMLYFKAFYPVIPATDNPSVTVDATP